MLNVNILFYFSSLFLIICAFMVIIAQHPVFSLIFLVSSFLFASILLFILECEFLALIFIIIYVGAIAVLFLFAIMMLESKFIDLYKNSMKYFPISFIFSIALLLPLIREISVHFKKNAYFNSIYFNKYQNWFDLVDSITDVESYGQVLYSYFVLQFLVSGLILLLVLIAVVYLTNSFRIKQTTDQSIFKQLSRNSKFFLK